MNTFASKQYIKKHIPSPRKLTSSDSVALAVDPTVIMATHKNIENEHKNNIFSNIINFLNVILVKRLHIN